MVTRTANSAKRAREEDPIDSSLKGESRDAKSKRSVTSSHHPEKTRSAKRARDEDRSDCRKRRRLANREEELTTLGLSSDKRARQSAKPAARARKHRYSRSKAAGDSETVSKKATSALRQVSACCFLLHDLPQSMTSVLLSVASKAAGLSIILFRSANRMASVMHA